MINFTMLVHNRPELTKQAFSSLYEGESKATVTILADRTDGDTFNYLLFLWASCHKNDNWNCVYNEAPMGTGPLRNLVVHASQRRFGRGSHLYLSDNDVFFLRKDWIKILTECYEEAWEQGYRAIGAYNHPFHHPVSTYTCSNGFLINEVNALASQSMLMRWEVWDEFGPFCQTPVDKVCQSEDVDFCNRIRDKGFKVGVISPALLANTGITNSFGEKIPGWELVKSQCPKDVICE